MNLVFASGFLLPQHVGPIEYFNGVEQLVIKKGHPKPLSHLVPPIGKSEARAAVLATAIRGHFPSGPIHIIAHSMGGLDSRFLIARNADLAGRIVSLTTLSTPFHGSPLADLVRGESAELISLALAAASDLINDTVGRLIDIGAVGDLTRTGAEAGPDVAKTHPKIRYRSYAASGRASGLKTSGILLIPHRIVSKQGPNDGAVSVESAKYGEFQETWECDHLDMVGHDLDDFPRLRPRKFDHRAKFDAIIDKLQTEHPGT